MTLVAIEQDFSHRMTGRWVVIDIEPFRVDEKLTAWSQDSTLAVTSNTPLTPCRTSFFLRPAV